MRLLPRFSGQLLVVLDLEPPEALVVGSGVPDDLRADGALGIRAPFLGIAVDAREALGEEGCGGLRIGEALDVHKARFLVQQQGIERVRVDPEKLVCGDRDGARVHDLARVGIHRFRLLADRELHACVVEDRSTPGRDHDRLVVLAFGHPAECGGVDALQPDGAGERPRKDESKGREQQADPAVDLPVLHYFARFT